MDGMRCYLRKILWGLTVAQAIILSSITTVMTTASLRLKGVHIGRHLRVTGFLQTKLHPDAVVRIGDHVRINSGFVNNAVGGYRRSGLDVGRQAKFSIGSGVAISNSTFVCREMITIEDDVFIGGDCGIYDTDFHPLDFTERIQGGVEKVAKRPILIKKGAFIGAHSIILKGVTIGEYAIIGAGSVVSKNIPDREIWAGNPIQKIREIPGKE